MSEEKLESCPFCGGEMHHEYEEVDLGGGLFYERTVFDCQNVDCVFSCSFSESEEKAIERFNSRPIEDALRARVQELEAENKKLKKENDELEAEAQANFI